MTVDLRPLREILNKISFKFLAPIFYLTFILSILLYVVLSPLIYLYGLLLCTQVWIEWAKQGKDAIVIQTESEHSQEWISRLLPLIGDRAFLLNYSERDRWDRWSLPAQLFEIFGPRGMPERFTPHSLPAVIVFRKFHRPRKFTFGERSKESEEKLNQLRAELVLD